MTAKEAYRTILRFYKHYTHTQGSEFELIHDNLYLLKQRVFGVKSIKNTVTAFRVKKYLLRSRWSFSTAKFCEYFLTHKWTLTISEVYSLRDILCTLLTHAIAEQCVMYEKNGRGSFSVMKSALSSIRQLNDIDTEDIFERLCPAEKLLDSYEGFFKGDKQTKNSYREALVKYARKHRCSEYRAMEKAGEKCTDGRIYDILSPFSKTPCVLYYTLSVMLGVLISIAGIYLLGWLGVFAVLPVFESVFNAFDMLFSRFIKVKPPLKLDTEQIPTDCEVLVVITTLLFGKEKDSELFSRLEEFYLRNSRQNIRFGILGDFPDSKKPVLESDVLVIQNAKEQLEVLNSKYNNVFSLFIRNRFYNATDKIYGGRERKRGAVCDIISAINGGSFDGAVVCPFDIKNISYLLTLDSDTELPIDGAAELLSVALHPENKPVVKNGRVVSGYGIYQPSMRTRLADTAKTYHSLFGSQSSGLYEQASYDRYQTLTGSGVFCGKGLIDTRLFYGIVQNSLPDGIILSHDVIEGGLIRCMLVSSTVFCDSTPKNSISYFRRQHRWVRGDVQNAFLIGSKKSNPALNFRLIENIRRLLTPVFAVTGIFLSAFFATPKTAFWLFLLFTLNLWLAPISGIMSTLSSRSYTPRRFFSRCVGILAQSVEGFFYSICSLMENGATTADALIRSVWRMLFSKKMLIAWTTFSEADSKSNGSFTFYAQTHVASVFSGTLMVAFSELITFKLCGILWFFYPLVAYYMSLPINEHKTKITDAQQKDVVRYAREIYGYFEQNVSKKTHYLPPDNIQLSPSRCVAYRTSPTNMGFYLLCLISARDFGFIDSATLASMAEKFLATVEIMEKSHGHLFNWYDIKSLSPIGGKYLSAVDSGNFVTMLVCASEGLLDYASEDTRLSQLAEKCNSIAQSADFSIFYNKKKCLLYLGCNADGKPEGSICYDMLMSEVRTTCYWLCATGRAPKKLWQSLSRTITAENGYIGMVSWAGSCFEYFMPELFLHREKNSFIDETMRFVCAVQKRYRKNGVYGVSESGYFSFDPNMNYRYKANGVPRLALKRYNESEFTVSPYSSFLMMCDDPYSSLKNLKNLEEMGCHGKYGFYEALDLQGGESIVMSYMAHHLGMSMTACANLCFDGIFVKRFMRNKQIYAHRELLSESIPKDAMLYIDDAHPTRETAGRRFAASGVTTDKVSLADPKASFASGGGLTLISSSSGHIYMKCGDFAINNCEFSYYRGDKTASFVFYEKGEKRCITPLENNTGFSYEYSGGHFAYTSSSASFPASVIGTVYKNSRCFAFKTKCASDKYCRVGFAFVPVLAKPSEYASHPAFMQMFVESDYDPVLKILYFKRRGGSFPNIAVALADSSLDISFTSSCKHLLSHGINTMSDVFPLPEKPEGIGTAVSPLCALLTPEIKGGEAVFLVACGDSFEECEKHITKARKKQFPKRHPIPPITSATELLTDCCFKSGGSRLSPLDSSMLWRFSLSGSLPLCVMDVYEETSEIPRVLEAYLALKNAFISTELLFIVHEQEKYLAPLRTFIEKAIEPRHRQFMNQTAGIAIANAEDISEDENIFLREFAVSYFESDSIEKPKREYPIFTLPEIKEKKDGGGVTDYSPSGIVTDTKKQHYAPYSYIMSGYACGSVVTHKTLGFVFWRNARECKLTPFSGDPYDCCKGIRIIASDGGVFYDLASYADKVLYESGVATYSGNINGHSFELCVYARSKLPAVEYAICFADGYAPSCTIIKEHPKNMTAEEKNGVWYFSPMENGAAGFAGFMKSNKKCRVISDSTLLFCMTDTSKNDILALSCKQDSVIFAIGGAPTVAAAEKVSRLCCTENMSFEAKEFASSHIPQYVLETGNNGLDSMFSFFAPYQTAISRFIAKTGYYQSSGAYGFRDQLQDCFALIYSRPNDVKVHILRCCAHQYREGDVMHWWFKGKKGDTGIRTKCSDDLLYLPWAVANYVEKTGDTDILSAEVPYMESPTLEAGERYEVPRVSKNKESVYMHCIRALAKGESTGEHGLSLMGSCDWNDGMSKVGVNGLGESVFTSWLYVLVCREFLPIMKLMNDSVGISHFTQVSSRLILALESFAFSGDRYIRAVDDNGVILGKKGMSECEIDVISQAFASVVLGKTERTAKAMNTALSRLFDKKAGIFKMFDPPFDKYDAGYISSYCKGLRENGGQYTHAALWGVLGLIRCGETAKAFEVLNSIMPYSHTDEKTFAVEPYVITADIYGGSQTGRGGWSWYTGSASWFFVIVLEEILGIRLFNGFKLIDVLPLTDYSLSLKLPSGNLSICVSPLFAENTLDGEKIRLPLLIPEGDHTLQIRRNTHKIGDNQAETVNNRQKNTDFI